MPEWFEFVPITISSGHALDQALIDKVFRIALNDFSKRDFLGTILAILESTDNRDGGTVDRAGLRRKYVQIQRELSGHQRDLAEYIALGLSVTRPTDFRQERVTKIGKVG